MTIPAMPTESDTVEITTDQDWLEAWEFSVLQSDGVTELPRDFTGCTVVGGILSKTADRLDLTSGGDAPTLTISDNVVTTNVRRTALLAIPAGLYAFDLTVIDAAGVATGLIRGQRRLVRGVLT